MYHGYAPAQRSRLATPLYADARHRRLRCAGRLRWHPAPASTKRTARQGQGSAWGMSLLSGRSLLHFGVSSGCADGSARQTRQLQFGHKSGGLPEAQLQLGLKVFWMGYAAAEVAPVVARLHESVLFLEHQATWDCIPANPMRHDRPPG